MLGAQAMPRHKAGRGVHSLFVLVAVIPAAQVNSGAGLASRLQAAGGILGKCSHRRQHRQCSSHRTAWKGCGCLALGPTGPPCRPPATHPQCSTKSRPSTRVSRSYT